MRRLTPQLNPWAQPKGVGAGEGGRGEAGGSLDLLIHLNTLQRPCLSTHQGLPQSPCPERLGELAESQADT